MAPPNAARSSTIFTPAPATRLAPFRLFRDAGFVRLLAHLVVSDAAKFTLKV